MGGRGREGEGEGEGERGREGERERERREGEREGRREGERELSVAVLKYHFLRGSREIPIIDNFPQATVPNCTVLE